MTTERRAFSSCSSPPCSPLAAVRPWPDRRQQKPGWNEPSDASYHHRSSPQSRLAPRSSCASRQHGQRCATTGNRGWTMLLVVAMMMVLMILGRGVGANEVYTAEPYESWTELVYDRSEPPAWPMRLQARQETTASVAATTSSSYASASASSTSGETINTATPTGQSPLPTPFDSSLGNNFTAPSCPAFFRSFLSNESFTQCTPLSLLLQTSNSFFAAERSLPRLTQTLDATCNVDFPTCSTTMASLAQQIQLPSNCGADLQLQNPMVLQAYNGFIGYGPLYHAGCLTDLDGNYCFANAVTNSSAPTSSYIYYLPLGVQLPAGTQPACNTCLQNTMTIFAAAASNDSVPLSNDYTAAAHQVDTSCGPSFVEASVRTTSASSAALTAQPLGWAMVPLVVVLWGLLV